jgi:hypothetical protein
MISANAPIAVQATKAVVAYSESILEKGLGPYSIDMSLEKCWTPRTFMRVPRRSWKRESPNLKGYNSDYNKRFEKREWHE